MNSLGYITSCLTFISSCFEFEKASKCKAFVYPWIMISYLLIGFDIGFFLCLFSIEAATYSLALLEYLHLGRIVWNVIGVSVGMIYIKTIEEVARNCQCAVLKSQSWKAVPNLCQITRKRLYKGVTTVWKLVKYILN